MKLISARILGLGLAISMLLPALTLAASRNAGGGDKIVGKLQTMVRDITAERDQLKAAGDQLKAENDKLKAELDKAKQEKTEAAQTGERLNNELNSQKSTNEAVRGKLEQTHAKLLEVIEKYKMLSQAKNDLAQQHASLQNTQKLTGEQLQICEDKNLKLFEAGQQAVKSFEDKGLLDTLLHDEPLLQFKTVEMENLVQEYEDKLLKQQYQHKEIPAANPAQTQAPQPAESSPEPEVTEQPQEQQ